MSNLWADLRIAARRLRHSPGFVATALLTLAMAITANLVVFGVLNAVIFRPLNVADADRVFLIEQKAAGFLSQSYPDYQDYRARNHTFSDMAAFRIRQSGVSVQGKATENWDYEVSGNYFDMLGVKAELGRLFHASDEHGPDSMPYIVLSDGFWRSRFNANPNIIGTSLEVNKHAFTVLGVAPPAFHGTELFLWPDFWIPVVNSTEVDQLHERYNHSFFVLGVLKPGVTLKQATSNLNVVAAGMAKEHPNADDQLGARLVTPGIFGDELGGPAREFLSGVLLLALLVLIAACVNLAGIFAARAADRSRELAVRMAIGSSRWRVLRQVLAEAALLSLAGCIAGTVAAASLLKALSQWQPIPEYPIHVTVTADGRVYAVAGLLAVISCVLPAILTARQIWRTDVVQAMRTSGQILFRKMTVREVLLGMQVALCGLLVTCALVALRGMQRSLDAPLGFRPQGAILVQTEMSMSGYSDASALPVEKRMIEDAVQIPGVSAVGTINETPLNGGGSSTPVYREGTREFRASKSAMVAKNFSISPGYLKAAGTRLLAGRDITWEDNQHAPRVALVNETFAHILFGNTPAVGRHFTMPGPTDYEIVGVVEDGKYDALTENPKPVIFWPLAQNRDSDITLVVRSVRTPAEMTAALNTMMSKIDPSLPVSIQTWWSQLALALFPARVASVMLGILGLLAGVLVATGIFGMASYSVTRRLREMGIRVALGAKHVQVLRAALSRTVILLAGGSLAGLLLGVGASRVLASIVYEATVFDPLVLAGTIAALVVIGTASAALPAWRALHANPALLLREE